MALLTTMKHPVIKITLFSLSAFIFVGYGEVSIEKEKSERHWYFGDRLNQRNVVWKIHLSEDVDLMNTSFAELIGKTTKKQLFSDESELIKVKLVEVHFISGEESVAYTLESKNVREYILQRRLELLQESSRVESDSALDSVQ